MSSRLRDRRDLDGALESINLCLQILNKHKDYASDFKESLIEALLLKSNLLIEKRLFKVKGMETVGLYTRGCGCVKVLTASRFFMHISLAGGRG